METLTKFWRGQRDMPEGPDASLRELRSRPLRRMLRNGLLAVLLMALFLRFVGVPHVQVTYTHTGSATHRVKLNARYLGPTGWRWVSAGEFGPGCPFLIFIPLEKPLPAYVGSAVQWLWRTGRDQLRARLRETSTHP